MRASLIFSLIIAVIAIIFALQNPQMIEVNLLFVETQGSAALVLIVTFGLGVVVGLLSTLPGRLRARKELKKLKQRLEGPSDAGPASPGSSPSSSMPDVPPSSSSE